MNTKNSHDAKNQRQKTQRTQGPKKQGQSTNVLHNLKHHDHEYPETRLTR